MRSAQDLSSLQKIRKKAKREGRKEGKKNVNMIRKYRKTLNLKSFSFKRCYFKNRFKKNVFLSCLFFFFLRAAPAAYGCSQARGLARAPAMPDLSHGCSLYQFMATPDP